MYPVSTSADTIQFDRVIDILIESRLIVKFV